MLGISLRVVLFFAVMGLARSGAQGQMIVAHRGASHDAPENTMAAFDLAWQQGSSGIEGDFYLTADKQIVCIHDADTMKTAGRKLMVEKSTLKQLRELEYGAWKGAQFQGESIPTFDQVLACVPVGKTFVIELKSKLKIVPALVEALKRSNTDEIKLLIITFDEATATECKRQLPDVKVHWLTSFDKRQSPPTPTAEQIASVVRRSGVDGVGMKGDTGILNGQFVQTLQQAGCKEFHVWTVDSIRDAKYFQQLGAIGITTNVPAVIANAIRRAQ
jgi:glycerophosphoryl diester phosphodiesterase